MVASKPTMRIILNLDPRTKMALAGMGSLCCILTPSPTALAILYMGLIGMIAAAAALRGYARWLLLVLPMALFFGLVSGLTLGAGSGLMAGLKLLTLMTAGFVFFVSTTPEDLGNALIQSGLPYTVAFVMSAGLQFVPVMGDKARHVIEAQQARGLPVTFGWKALRYYPAFLLPLLVQAFQMAEELAEAMETRGFGRAGRSFLTEFRFQTRDRLALAAALAFSAGWIWNVVL
jgi:energy-coupling factor transport system permease protein